MIEARGSADGVGVVKRIGDYRPTRNPTFAGAVRALGEPTSTSGGGSEACRVHWRGSG